MRTDVIVAKKLIVQDKEKILLQAILHEEIPAEGILDLLDIRHSDDKLTLNVIKALLAKNLQFDAENISNEYYLQLANHKSAKEAREKKLSSLMKQYKECMPDKSLLKQALACYVDINSKVINSLNDSYETEPAPESIDLISMCPNNPIALIAGELAKIAKMPRNTTFLTVLAMFSALACRYTKVSYKDGDTIPTSLFFCGEQPSGTSKSRISNFAKKHIVALAERDKEQLQKKINSLEDSLVEAEDKKEVAKIKKDIAQLEKEKFGLFAVFTDATPEALDARLKLSNGFFVLQVQNKHQLIQFSA